MKRFYLIIMCICAYITANAQCTTVNEDGSVTITYGEVSNADIERENGGIWTVIGQLENGTYTDKNVNANDKSIKYRIPVSSVQNEFSTVFCTVKEKTDNTDILVIEWTAQPNATGYKLYAKTVDDNDFVFLTDIAADKQSFETNKSSECGVTYRVEAIENNCSSFSNSPSSPKQDNEEPQSPELQSVSVDVNTQKIVVSWTPSQSADTKGYVICKTNENGIRQTLDTVYGIQTSEYICNKCNVLDTNLITVFAFDNCKNTSPLSETYNNIVLKGERNDCNEPLVLSWNPPDTKNQFRTYEIYMATDEDQEYKQIGTTAQLSYSVTLPQVDGKVYFYVKHTGNSNVVSVNVASADTLDFIYIEGVSVSPDNLSATIYLFLDAGKKVKGYQLWRKTDDEAFEMVQDIAFTGYSYIKLTDQLPLPASEHIYTYYAAVADACGGNYTYSNQFTVMQLSVDASNSSKIKLSWNPLKPVNWNVSGYEVYRFAEGDFDNAELINRTSANSYTDNSDEMVSATDRTFYYVKAIAANSENPDITTEGINSSNAYAKFESILFVPNAFCPKDGIHENLRTFKPACHFVRAGTYSFKVFTRTGTLLFETNDPDKGWNGKYKDEFCPVGSYVYKISFIDSDGMEQNKGGVFLLYD